MTGTTAAPAMPELREATFDDYEKIIALESSQALRARSKDVWTRLWTENPVYRKLERWPIGWVLEDGQGEVVGCVGNVPSEYEFEGRRILASNGRAWAVKPEYRGYALLLMSEFYSQPGIELYFNTTVNHLAAPAMEACGARRVPAGDWTQAAFWITNYGKFAQTAARLKELPVWLAPGIGAALTVKDAFRRKLPAARMPVAELKTFDHRFDGFWQRLRNRFPDKLLGVRDAEALQWRYGAGLKDGRHWVMCVNEGRDICAYMILQRRDHAASGLTRIRCVDFQAVGEIEAAQAALLAAVLEKCRQRGVQTVEQVGLELNGRAFDQYAPHRRKLEAWPYYYQAMDPLAAKLESPDVWLPSSFDGDASL